ncbi:antibiotic acetyltransferase [Butyricicoccus sp. 1XD8-22]|nr:antibiotic acetyltransferase [Butyricicoccus sp. 1XD8-22]
MNNTDKVRVKKIGSFCSINHRAILGTEGNHPLDLVSTHPFLYSNNYDFIDGKIIQIKSSDVKNEVFIGNDVWIGTNAVILPGVTIGNGAVIGAGAIVTKDVPPYAIVVGVPARVLRYRFTEEQIEMLEKIQWWEWDDSLIKERINDFYDIDKFIEKYY